MSEPQPEITGAICAPPDPVVNGLDHPRQPSNLQGLLRFALDATKAEDAPESDAPPMAPLDEERRVFLEQALQSLTIDVTKELSQHIKTFDGVEKLKIGDDVAPYVDAFGAIVDYICDIDTANDFEKIGGFSIVAPCLRCEVPVIRAEVCNLLAEVSQNNPYCQRVVLEMGIFSKLMESVEREREVQVVVKALYAISCVVRENSRACAFFIQQRGVQVFLEALKRKEEKINTKICFLLQALCRSQPDFKSRLIFNGYVPVLFKLLKDEPNHSHEHVLGLLLSVLQDNVSAVNDLKQNHGDEKEVLEKYLEAVKGKEEFSTEEEHTRILRNKLFPQN